MVVAAIVVALTLGSTGVCEAAMTLADSVMACCPALAECPLHAPASGGTAPQPAAQQNALQHTAPQVPPCCAISSGPVVPVLPESATTATAGARQVSTSVAIFSAPVATKACATPRSSPVRQVAVPRHLLFSVFLL
ncbi:MAG: hypothetical protein Q7J25_00670 [Vicinamibacterales bacterium]|nr:hypothetical protein [Vicinamibacterales bacterium]